MQPMCHLKKLSKISCLVAALPPHLLLTELAGGFSMVLKRLLILALGALSTAAYAEWDPNTTLTLETDVPRIIRRATEARDTKVEVPAEIAAQIRKAEQGDIIDMGSFDMEPLPIIPLYQEAGGPPLLFADDPEYIRVPEGAVLREHVHPGRNRFYLYHVNGTTDTVARITAVIENLGNEPMKLQFHRYAFPGVSTDYAHLGKEGIRQFLTSKPDPKVRTVAPGEVVPFDENVETTTVKFDQLVHGWYEFEVDQPARLTVLKTDVDTPGPVANARLKGLIPGRTKSGAGRGYYHYSEYDVVQAPGDVLDTTQGVQQIFLADGTLDRWLTGWDSNATTLPVQLKGNYGVLYKIRLKRTSSDGKALALLTWNARTKSGCKAMGAATQVSEGKFPAGVVMVPTKEKMVRGGDKAVLLQVFPPVPKGQTQEIEVIYTPPGASCLPTPLFFMPVDAEQ